MDLTKGSNNRSLDLNRHDSLCLNHYILCLRLISFLFFTSSTEFKPASPCGFPELKKTTTLFSGPLSQEYPCMPHFLPLTTFSQVSAPVIFLPPKYIGRNLSPFFCPHWPHLHEVLSTAHLLQN